MAFSLTCVESNLKIKFTLAVLEPVLMPVLASFWQEVNKKAVRATIKSMRSCMLVCFWLSKVGVNKILTLL